MEFRGHGGVMHFGISEGKGGLKYGSRPSVGTDIFWNRPINLADISTVLCVELNNKSHRLIY